MKTQLSITSVESGCLILRDVDGAEYALSLLQLEAYGYSKAPSAGRLRAGRSRVRT